MNSTPPPDGILPDTPPPPPPPPKSAPIEGRTREFAAARAALARHLRDEARQTRKDTPSDQPSPHGHQIDTDGMLAYAELCESTAATLEAAPEKT